MVGFRESYAWSVRGEECLAWSAIIRLDLVRSVNKILDALDDCPETPRCLESLRFRLGPLRRVQLDLEEHLGLVEGEKICTTSVSELVKQRQLRNPGVEEVVRLIFMCRGDMAVLWKDDDVRTKLETYGIRLDEHFRL